MEDRFERKVEYLMLSDGTYPCAKWIDGLNKQAQARIQTAIDKARRGLRSIVKALGEGVYEIKVDFGPGYRVYFGEDGDKIILLISGGDKRTQTEDIKRAKALWRVYETNKKL